MVKAVNLAKSSPKIVLGFGKNRRILEPTVNPENSETEPQWSDALDTIGKEIKAKDSSEPKQGSTLANRGPDDSDLGMLHEPVTANLAQIAEQETTEALASNPESGPEHSKNSFTPDPSRMALLGVARVSSDRIRALLGKPPKLPDSPTFAKVVNEKSDYTLAA